MNLKIKILLLAIIPMLLVTILIVFLSTFQIRALSEQEIQTFEANLITSKRSELTSYVDLARTSIKHVLNDPSLSENEVKLEVKRILNGLVYGEDGYFFVYDKLGVNLVHPITPELVGQNLFDLQAENGDYIIRSLLDASKNGGGYHQYPWNKPSDNSVKQKLSYVVNLERWQWMMGTGLYLDDIEAEVAKIREQVEINIRDTFFKTLLIVLTAIIIITAIGFAINLRETRLADTRLQESVLKFVQLQVSERRRFARELHDGINQLLVAVKYRIETANNKITRNEKLESNDLNKCSEVLDETIREVRRISHDLRPSLLDDMGLEPAVVSLLDQFQERTKIKVISEIDLEDCEVREDIEITLYRLIQEALTNIEKHASASRVQLRIGSEQNKIVFSISDNGVGFDQSKKALSSDGIGLKNMRERVELLSGDFTLSSKPDKGTSIRIVLYT
jgi:two-component system NarL family sensor kinase